MIEGRVFCETCRHYFVTRNPDVPGLWFVFCPRCHGKVFYVTTPGVPVTRFESWPGAYSL
jgi:Zn finger protein HypA/HybF involved in hydrogenase expression